MAIWTRTSRLALCCTAMIAIAEPAAACYVSGPIEKHWEAAAAIVRSYWLASLLVGGLLLCLDAYQRRVSFPLLVAAVLHLLLGWLLHRTPDWSLAGFDCEPWLLPPVQLVLALTLALLAYRIYRTVRPKLTRGAYP